MLLILLGLPLLIFGIINFTTQSYIYHSVQETPARPVAIVFGAGLALNGAPGPLLADRVDGGIALYKAGKVQTLLMSGDSTTNREVSAMRNYAINHGVPASAILGDNAGLRTYDSCYRAIQNFGISSAVLVTQGYHLPRAIYLCRSLGMDAVGLKSGTDYYPDQPKLDAREFWAVLLSWVDINVSHPQPEIDRVNQDDN